MGWTAEEIQFECRQGKKWMFPQQPPYLFWDPHSHLSNEYGGNLLLDVERPANEADHSLPLVQSLRISGATRLLPHAPTECAHEKLV
jgi:hypothetical protein